MLFPLQLAFAVNDNYAKYLGATLLSILDQHKGRQVVAHVLYKDLSADLLADLAVFAASQPELDLRLHQISRQDFLGIPEPSQQFPLESFFRFILPELLLDLERVLYLDVDILVKGDLSSLFELDLQGKELAAVRESDIYAYYQWYLDELGFSPEVDYFSSGVLLMDLHLMRENQTAQKLLSVALGQSRTLKFPDQDILNCHYRGHYYALPSSYNYTDHRKKIAELADEAVIIEHFNGDIKAWQAITSVREDLQASVRSYQAYQVAYRRILDKPRKTLLLPVSADSENLKACLESLAEQTDAGLRVICLVGHQADLSGQLYGFSQAENQAGSSAIILEKDTENQEGLLSCLPRDLSQVLSTYLEDERFKLYPQEALRELLAGDQLGLGFGFVSADGKYDPYYVERLWQALEDSQAGLALTSFAVFKPHKGVFAIYPEEFEAGRVFESRSLFENLYQHTWFDTQVHLGAVGKLYRTSLLAVVDLNLPLDQLVFALYLAAGQLVIGPNRLYLKPYYQDDETALVSAQQVREAYEQLMGYYQFLKAHACQTSLFEARLPDRLYDLRQKAKVFADKELQDQISQSLQLALVTL